MPSNEQKALKQTGWPWFMHDVKPP